MKIKERIKKGWKNIIEYLKRDSWDSWFVSLILVFIFIKFIFFPSLVFITGSSLPLVVVESCSMYHDSNFEDWWYKNSAQYNQFNISKEDFIRYNFKNGLNKGDIILTWGRADYKQGDIIIFNADTKYPLIHRIISEDKISTKGDHNPGQLPIEKSISENQIIGKSVIKIPLIGWLKLIFFEPFKPESERGLCK